MSIVTDILGGGQRRDKGQLIEQAMEQTERGQWEESVDTNRRIIEIDSEDVAALNRLGRALVRLGRLREALEAYQRAVEIEPANAIAKRNATRLVAVLETLGEDSVPGFDAGPLRSEPFVMQAGRSSVLALENIGPDDATATLLPGDMLQLVPDGPYLRLLNGAGQYVGLVPADRAGRLLELISHGNTYSAIVVSASVDGIRVLIQETHRSPETHGKLPFPPVARPTVESRAAARAATLAAADEEYVDEADIDDDVAETDEPTTEPLPETEDVDEVEE